MGRALLKKVPTRDVSFVSKTYSFLLSRYPVPIFIGMIRDLLNWTLVFDFDEIENPRLNEQIPHEARNDGF